MAGTTIGTFTGGSAGANLVISFNANATPAAASALIQNITFENTDNDNPTTGTRNVHFRVSDGDGGTSVSHVAQVNVSAVNDVPTIINLDGDTLNYNEGDGQQIIEQGGNAVISDVDSSDFDGGTLTASFSAGSDSAEDVLSIRNQGTSAGQIGVSGSNVSFGGTTIGTFTGGSGGTDLVVTFNANATSVGVTMVLQNLTYENTDTGDATVGNRTVDFVVTDGDGGTSATHQATVAVGGVNDAPVLTSGPGGGTYNENGSGTYFNNGLTITDADSADFDGGVLTTTITAAGESTDRLLVRDGNNVSISGSNVEYDFGGGPIVIGSFTGGDGADPLVITFNSSSTAASVEAVAQQVAFRSVSENPSTAQRSLSMSVTDGDGGTSANANRVMNVMLITMLRHSITVVHRRFRRSLRMMSTMQA